MVDIDELERLAKEATGGKWHWEQQRRHGANRYLYSSEVDYLELAVLDCGFPTCDYIAACDPPTVLGLIARLRQAEQERDELKDRLAETSEALEAIKQSDIDCHNSYGAMMDREKAAEQRANEAERERDMLKAKLADAEGNARVPFVLPPIDDAFIEAMNKMDEQDWDTPSPDAGEEAK